MKFVYTEKSGKKNMALRAFALLLLAALLIFAFPAAIAAGGGNDVDNEDAVSEYAEIEGAEGEDGEGEDEDIGEVEDGEDAEGEDGDLSEGEDGEGEEDGEDGDDGDDFELMSSDEYYGRFRGRNVFLNVYNWGEYISDGSDDSFNVNRAFTELTGISINYTTFATNEELYSKLRSGYSSYDVIIPSDYMIGRMINEGMLLPLDFGNIPNMQFIDERFASPPYDPGGRYSMPYTWGYVGIIYNKNKIFDEEELSSWDILWDEKYLGEILMFSNSRDAFAIAQVRQGYSMNTTDERELADCLEQLKLQKPLVQAYVMDEIYNKMLGGEATLAPYYAGDALIMISENDDLDFAVPEEGTNLFVDAMCIPAGSAHKEAAEMYINFMLEPAVGAANSEFIGYATPNEAAMELIDDEMRNDPIAYPEDEMLENTESFSPLPQDTSRLMDSLWTELLSNDDTYNRLLMPMMLLAAVLFSLGLNVYRAGERRRSHKNY